MYNPVAQRRRASTVKLPSASYEDCDHEHGHRTPRHGTAENLETTRNRGVLRKRRGNLTRKGRVPILKPSWVDYTAVRYQPTQPCLSQARVGPRRRRLRVRGRVCVRGVRGVRSGSGMRRSPRHRRRTGKAASSGDGRVCRERATLSASRRSNQSNNRGRSPRGTGRSKITFSRKRPSLQDISACQKKKSVAFQAEAGGSAPCHRSRSAPWRCGHSPRETPWSLPVTKCQRHVCCKPNYSQMVAACQPAANSKSNNSAQCRRPCCSETSDLCPGGGSRLTFAELEAFKYLAERLLQRDGQHPAPSATQAHTGKKGPTCCLDRLLDSQDPNHGSFQCCADSAINAATSPECYQRRGRNKSRSAKRPFTATSMPRSKSLCNLKLSQRTAKLGSRTPRSALDPVVACTKAMSSLQLKEKELMERYGPSPAGSSTECGGSCPGRHSNVHVKPPSRPWESTLTRHDGHHMETRPSSLYSPQSNGGDCLKKPFPWNLPGLEKNVSHNRYVYSSNRVRNPVGFSSGISRYYTPPSPGRCGSSALPWSSALQMSLAQPRTLHASPRPELKLISKYLADDGGLGRPASPRPVQVALEVSGRQIERPDQAPASGLPWRRVEAGVERACKNFSLDKLPGTKAASGWPWDGTFQNFLGGWRGRGAADTNCSGLSSDLNGLDGILSSAGRWKVSSGSSLLPSSLAGTALSQDWPATDAYTSGLKSASAASAPIYQLMGSGGCGTHSPGLSSMAGLVPPSGVLGSDRQDGPGSTPRPVESYFKVEEERLKRIGSILG